MHELWSDVMELVGEMEVIEAVLALVAWENILAANRSSKKILPIQ